MIEKPFESDDKKVSALRSSINRIPRSMTQRNIVSVFFLLSEQTANGLFIFSNSMFAFRSLSALRLWVSNRNWNTSEEWNNKFHVDRVCCCLVLFIGIVQLWWSILGWDDGVNQLWTVYKIYVSFVLALRARFIEVPKLLTVSSCF